MELFNKQFDPDKNYLPFDGTVRYWGKIFNDYTSDKYFKYLLANIEWKNDEVIIFGKHIITKRKTAWYAERPYEYTYSKIKRKAIVWIPLLREIKKYVENHTGEKYNSCLLNLYHNGMEGMTWHSDDETDLKKNGSIASLTFGAERKFVMKHKKSKKKISFNLQSGDLLEMKDETQTYWLHSIPKTKKVTGARINLTFRQMIK